MVLAPKVSCRDHFLVNSILVVLIDLGSQVYMQCHSTVIDLMVILLTNWQVFIYDVCKNLHGRISVKNYTVSSLAEES